MATVGIPYLQGGEKPTASLMNSLHMTLDRKLTRLLSGKSPIIAQAGTFPAFLLGKCFFFTSSGAEPRPGAVYAPKVPGYQSNSTIPLDGGGSSDPVTGLPYPPGYVHPTLPVARPYNPWQCTTATGGPYTDEFTTAISVMMALNGTTPGTITFDETNKIANINTRFPSASGDTTHYPTIAPSTMGLPCYTDNYGSPSQNVGLLENSMTAHYLLHQGASDTSPVPYYLKDGPCAVERHSDWGVAEIIIEGPTSITLPDTWDKYNFFRVHNLNSVACTVSFGGHFTLTLSPFGCGTVRRTAPTGSYAKNGNYFFYAQGEDPRFFWFIQTGMGNTNVANTSWGWDGRVTDTMAANNLTNPAGLLDWVTYFTRDVDDYPSYDYPNPMATIHAGFITDPTIQSDEYAHYAALFGDPCVPTTLLGDLLHHRGTVYAVQVSKIKFDVVSGKGYTQLIKGSFNGYATIVSDMAALGVNVSAQTAGGTTTTLTDPLGVLQLSNANPSAYDVYLIPTGTNFLKRGDVQASMVTLSGSALYPIESAVFEVDANAMDPGTRNVMNATPNLSVTPNQRSFPPVVTTAANTKSYYQWTNLPGDTGVPSATVITGPNLTTMSQPAWATAPVMGGIHVITVASLTLLRGWGGASSAHYTLSASLRLTPQGLALVWSEQFDGTTPELHTPSYPNWALGNLSLVQNHCIYFRGHGWGYTGSNMGSQAAGFLSCREPRYQVGNNFANETNNQQSPGSDFTYGKLDCTAVPVTTLTRNLGLFDWGGSRFWQSKRGGDDLIQRLASLSLPQFNVSAAARDGGGNHVFTLQNFDGSAATPSTMTLPSAWVDNRLGSNFVSIGTMPITEGAMPALCMALLPEMYNHIAATINRASKGVPLDYRALLWNFENHIFNFSPRYPAWGGYGYIGGNSFSYFTGPVPITQFCSFDSGSIFENFCLANGIHVSTTADFPNQSIITANHKSTAAIMIDKATSASSGAQIAWSGVNGTPATFSCTVSVNITTELLKNGPLLKGLPSGSLCLGQCNPNDISAGMDFGNALAGSYYVAANDQDPAIGTAKQGDLFFSDHILALGGTLNDATDPQGNTWNLVNNFVATDYTTGTAVTVNYKWLTLVEVEKFMLAQGFTLNFEEVIMPLTLTYIEDPFKIKVTNSFGTLHHTHRVDYFSELLIGPPPNLSGLLAALSAQASSNQQVVKLENGGGRSLKPMGTFLGWYVDTGPDPQIPSVMNAKWKLLNNGSSFYAPLPVSDLKSRSAHSSLCRIVEAWGGFFDSIIYTGTTPYNPDSNPNDWERFDYYGHYSGDPDPAIVGLGFSTDFGWSDSSCNIIAGQLPSASAVAFAAVEFTLAAGVTDDTPFKCMARSSYQEYDNHDNYDAYVLHTFGLPQALSVSLVGQSSWICAVDSWGSADGIFYLDGDNNLGGPGFGADGQNLGLLPWTALPAPANLTLGAGVTNPTSNGGSDVCTILQTPIPQQRYTALFNLARVAIDLTVGTTPATTQLLASSSLYASISQQL